MFDPTTGRWTTEDPIGFEAGDADLYRYVGNNPTNFTDPTGLYARVETKRVPPTPPPMPVVAKGDFVLTTGEQVDPNELKSSVDFAVETPDGSARGKGTVRVYPNATLTRKLSLQGGGTFDYTNENLFQIEFTSDVPTTDFHWIQFATVTATEDRTGKKRTNMFGLDKSAGVKMFSRLGETEVDGRPDIPQLSDPRRTVPGAFGVLAGSFGQGPLLVPSALPPGTQPSDAYYDTHGTHFRPAKADFKYIKNGKEAATDHEISMLDWPTSFDDKLDSEEKTVFDAYLVAGAKVYYHVHWEYQVFPEYDEKTKEVTGFNRFYTQIWGKPADSLPAIGAGDSLPGPYLDEGGKIQTIIPNPLSPPTGTK